MATLAETKLAAIQAKWAAGKTVYLYTATRITKMTPANAKKFADQGTPMLKVSSDGKDLLLIAGNKYVNANGCQITSDI